MTREHITALRVKLRKAIAAQKKLAVHPDTSWQREHVLRSAITDQFYFMSDAEVLVDARPEDWE